MSYEQRPPMPVKVAKAIAAIMGGLDRIDRTEHNTQGNYAFASIDDFMDAVRPLMAEHGLVIVQEQESWEILAGSDGDEDGEEGAGGQRGQYKKKKKAALLVVDYSFSLQCEEQAWAYRPRRTAMVYAAMGSQAFGAAQSYADKLFTRALFKVTTGAPDVDSMGAQELGGGRDTESTAAARELFKKHFPLINKAASFESLKEAWTAAFADKPKMFLDDWNTLNNTTNDRKAELKAEAATARREAEEPTDGPAPETVANADVQEPEPLVEPLAPDAPAVVPSDDDPFGFDQIAEAEQKRQAAVPATRPGAKRGGAETA